MKIIFSRDEVARILTDYIETMVDVKVIDVSKYLDDMIFMCERIDAQPQEGYCLTCGHAINDPLPFVKPAGLTD